MEFDCCSDCLPLLLHFHECTVKLENLMYQRRLEMHRLKFEEEIKSVTHSVINNDSAKTLDLPCSKYSRLIDTPESLDDFVRLDTFEFEDMSPEPKSYERFTEDTTADSFAVPSNIKKEIFIPPLNTDKMQAITKLHPDELVFNIKTSGRVMSPLNASELQIIETTSRQGSLKIPHGTPLSEHLKYFSHNLGNSTESLSMDELSYLTIESPIIEQNKENSIDTGRFGERRPSSRRRELF